VNWRPLILGDEIIAVQLGEMIETVSTGTRRTNKAILTNIYYLDKSTKIGTCVHIN